MNICKAVILTLTSITIIFFAATPQLYALDLVKPTILDDHMAGARIGAYTSTGDQDVPGDSDFSLEFSKSAMYMEFFYLHRISRFISLEGSLGLFNRGEARYFSSTETLERAIYMYPVQLSAKIYPLYNSPNAPLQIYLQPGLEMVYGRRDVVDWNPFYGWVVVEEEDRFEFNYFVGAGFDIPLFQPIAVNVSFKYMPIKFGDTLAGIEDYSGWILTVGAGYTFGN